MSETPVSHVVSVPDSKLDTITDVDILYVVGGKWHRVWVNMREMIELLHSAFYDGRPVCAIKLFAVKCSENEEDTATVVYDFVALHTDKKPWRIV